MRVCHQDSKTKTVDKGRKVPYTTQLKVEDGIAYMKDQHNMVVVAVKISPNEPDKAIEIQGVRVIEEGWLQPNYIGYCSQEDLNVSTTTNNA